MRVLLKVRRCTMMERYFTSNQIFNLTLLMLGAALLLRFNTRDIDKVHTKFLKDHKENQEDNSHNLIDYINELSKIQAAYALCYFYLILIAIVLVNLYIQ